MSESRDPPLPNGGYSHHLATEDRQADRLRQRHEEFVECLERHGPNLNGNDWSMLAEDLGWSVEEVQLHAYQYLTCLIEADATDATQASENGGSRGRVNGQAWPSVPWSQEEMILFDTLIATYRTANGSGITNGDWEDLIASHLPGRTARDVRRRYRQMYEHSDTQMNQFR
jgi:hypothetical protein